MILLFLYLLAIQSVDGRTLKWSPGGCRALSVILGQIGQQLTVGHKHVMLCGLCSCGDT